MPVRRLSVLMPVYNEEEFVAESIRRVLDAPLPEGVESELIVVDDGSNDGSAEIVRELANHCHRIRFVQHPSNWGKGRAIRTAIAYAAGEFSIIQDADLEYDPREYPKILEPLLDGRADAVFGSRFLVSSQRRVLYYWHSIANGLLTHLCNMAADVNLTDMETCYKAVRTSLLQSIPLRSERFGIEPELTIKLAQRGAAIYEVPISYHGRTYGEGKKIGWKDGVQALGVIAKYGLTRDIYQDPGARILDTLSRTPRFNEWMADTIRPYVGKRVLELGAGIGNLSRALVAKREEYSATDYDEEHIARLKSRFKHRPNVRIAKIDLSKETDFREFRESADTVICLNVVEHVEDDRAAMRNIASALVPGGTAIVLVPEGPGVYGSLDEVLGHYRRYNEAGLRALVESSGMTVGRMIKFNRVTRPGWWLNGRVLKRRHFGRFQLWAFDHLVWLWRKLDGSLPWNSVSLIAICRK